MDLTLSPNDTNPQHNDSHQRGTHQGDKVVQAATDAEKALSKLAHEATRTAANRSPGSAAPDFSAGPRVAAPSLQPVVRLPDDNHRGFDLRAPETREPKSRGRGAGRGFMRFLLAAGIGVAAVLAWQSYGEAARQRIAALMPQLGWSSSPGVKQSPPDAANEQPAAAQASPPAAGTAHPPAAALAPAAPDPMASPPSPELARQIEVMARDLAAVRQSVEQLAAGHDQMARAIARLQATEDDLQHRQPAPARKPTATPPRPTLQSLPPTLPPPRPVLQSSTPPALPPTRPVSQPLVARPAELTARPPGALP